jgi:hypothetical protein
LSAVDADNMKIPAQPANERGCSPDSIPKLIPAIHLPRFFSPPRQQPRGSPAQASGQDLITVVQRGWGGRAVQQQMRQQTPPRKNSIKTSTATQFETLRAIASNSAAGQPHRHYQSAVSSDERPGAAARCCFCRCRYSDLSRAYCSGSMSSFNSPFCRAASNSFRRNGTHHPHPVPAPPHSLI